MVALQAPLFDLEFVASYPEFNAVWDGLSASGLIRLPREAVKENFLKEMRGNNPINCVDKIAPRPLLIVAGGKDSFIPMDGIKKLFENAKEPKEFEIISKADHSLSNPKAKRETFKVITDFFKKEMLDD